MTEIKSIKATSDWVILEAKEVEAKEQKTAAGLILPGKQENGQAVNTQNGKKVCDLFVYDLGPDVPADVSFKVGDNVIVDNYDIQQVGDENKDFVICHYKKIKAVITTA